MAIERKTRLRGAQVLAKSIEASDLSGVGETIGNVATVQADGTIAYDAPTGGGGGGSTFKQTFVDGDLTADKITITHNLSTAHPDVIVYNNLDNVILPTETTYLTDDTIELDFTGTTPLTGTFKVRVFGATGATGAFRQSFTNADLTAGVLSAAHNLTEQYVILDIYDNNDLLIIPDEITVTDSNNLTVDLSTFGTITGTWNIVVSTGGSGSGSGGTSLSDADNDTLVEVEKNADEDIIRFTVFGTQEVQMGVNGLSLKTGTSVNEFSIDGTFAGNSDDAVPTEKAVKTFVDGELSGLSTDSISDADNDTKIQAEESADEDILRFDIAGTEQIILQDGALLPTTDNDIDLGSSSKKFKDLFLTGASLHLGDTIVTETRYNSNEINVVLNAFRIAINGSLTQQNMIDGIVDEYEDESGIDTAASTNESYDSVNDLYSPSGDFPSAEYTSDANTVLLLHMNGTDGSTTFIDDGNTGHSPTAIGNAQIDTADKQFGTASGLFDGTGDRLSIPDSSDWHFGTGDFTIDFWVKFDSISGTQIFVGQQVDGQNFWQITQFNGINTVFTMEATATATISIVIAWTHTTGIWYHYALVRSGSTFHFFIDGVSIGTGTNSDAIPDYATSLLIGGDLTGVKDFNGHMDELRISKGIARFTSNFDTTDNMILQSNSFTAETQPDNARIVIFEEDVDSVTLNTDLKAFASRDGGTTFTQITLVNEGEYESGRNILSASVDISAQPAGTSMEYKITTLNNKDLKIHGTGLSWD